MPTDKIPQAFIDRLANIIIEIAHQQKVPDPDLLLDPEMKKLWELVNIRFSRLPMGKKILQSLLDEHERLDIRSNLVNFLTEVMSSDKSFFQAVEKHLEIFEHQNSKRNTRSIENSENEVTVFRGEGNTTSRTKEDHGAGENVQFTAFYPKAIHSKKWYDVLAYVHLPKYLDAITEDGHSRLKIAQGRAGKSSTTAYQTIERGTEIIAVPELPGCVFNPPRSSILWLEDWHRLDFRLHVAETRETGISSLPRVGRIAFYVGPLLIAETPIWAEISDEIEGTSGDLEIERETNSIYHTIFVSYSHKDTLIVERLATAYKVLGMQYLRDVESLRSGERWNSALLKMITNADIFQLYWSNNAKDSEYVEQEWRHALSLGRENFIRPIFWEHPVPTPPDELNDLHFAHLEL